MAGRPRPRRAARRVADADRAAGVAAVPDAAGGEATPAAAWTELFDQLVAERRASRATIGGRTYWVAAERARSFSELFTDARFDPPMPAVEAGAPPRHEAVLAMVHGWMIHSGPVTVASLSARTGLPADDVETAMLTLESQGVVLRGQFVGDAGDLQWCERRLLARIHRLTIGRLRREIEPVTPAVFMRWLLDVATRRSGHADIRRSRHARGRPSAAGFRGARERVGTPSAGASHRPLRPEGARPALPHRRSRLGSVVAASGDAAKRRRPMVRGA